MFAVSPLSRGDRMLARRAEHDLPERGEAVLVEAEEPAEVHGAHLDRERVRERGGVVREEVCGRRDGDGVEDGGAGDGRDSEEESRPLAVLCASCSTASARVNRTYR